MKSDAATTRHDGWPEPLAPPYRGRPRLVGAAALAAGLVAARPAAAIPLLDGLGGPAGYGTGHLGPNDDDSSPPVDLTPAFPAGFRFFWVTHRAMFVNNNGNVTFAAPLAAGTPTPFPLAGQPMIAPWWADVDTRHGASALRGVWWHVEPGRVVVTWHDVGQRGGPGDVTNDFQLIFGPPPECYPSGDLDIEMRFHRCAWTGDVAALVGFDAGNRRDYVSLPMSRTPAIADVCRLSNVPGGPPGLWRYQVRGSGSFFCRTVFGRPCAVEGQRGRCALGIAACDGACVGNGPPRPRRCDGLDNDCDGVVDRGDDLCPAGQVCAGDECVARCAGDGGCPAPRVCSAEGACIDAACVGVTCPADERCEWGRCVTRCGVLCPTGLECRYGACVDPCEGIPCREREVCVRGACMPRCSCQPCAAGQTCRDDRCVPDDCARVTCPPGAFCDRGACFDRCGAFGGARLCPLQERCVAGACVPERAAAMDAGAADATAPRDAAVDAAPSPARADAGDGCGCRAGASRRGSLAALALALLTARPRRRKR